MPSRAERVFAASGRLHAGGRTYAYHPLRDLIGETRLPFSLKVVLESLARHCDGRLVTEENVRALAAWQPRAPAGAELPFMPARVILQDFTGVPSVVDLAAMRDAVRRLGGDAISI
ncbi:MAG: aconitate hydratase, partial [Candidatus Rokubacteria bacterium]|nr:aconitate hydratase [Candidatus Rokubacteria bacterium]